MVTLSSLHNNLLGKLKLLNINDLTHTALARFIEDIQDRRTSARHSALLTKLRKVSKPAKKKTTKKRKVVKRGKAKKLVLGSSN